MPAISSCGGIGMEAPAIGAAPQKKQLASFLDGTWNNTSDNTNVWRMKALCAEASKDGIQQLAYYDKGVRRLYRRRVSPALPSSPA